MRNWKFPFLPPGSIPLVPDSPMPQLRDGSMRHKQEFKDRMSHVLKHVVKCLAQAKFSQGLDLMQGK